LKRSYFGVVLGEAMPELLLPGDEERCVEAIQSIAEALEVQLTRGDFDGPSLSGACASALFFEYLHQSRLFPQYDGAAGACVNWALDWIEAHETGVGLYRGVAGVVWTLSHLRRIGATCSQSVDIDGLGETLVVFLLDGDALRDVDLLTGFVGFSA